MDTSDRLAAHAPHADPALTSRQRNVMMALLIVAVACSAMDRYIIATVVEPIRREFNLSDSQLGVITGLAYSVANALVSVPLGLMADRVNRRNMMAMALALWSLMTAFCGVAQSYAHLFLARMGVGAAEAGGQSTSLSMCSDLYPPHRRATAVSFLYMSYPIGGMLASLVGGAVAAAYGWRTAILVAAAPGFVIALAMMLFGRHPPRESVGGGDERAPPLGEVARFIVSQRAMLHVMIALALSTLTVAGQSMFVFPFFMRYHDMNIRDLGAFLGVAQGVLGIASLLAAGAIADRVGRRDPRMRLWVVAAALVLVTPVLLIAYVAPNPWALSLYLVHILAVNVWIGPGIAAVQNLSRPRMRASVASIMYLVNGVVGFGLGPLSVGALSDVLAPRFGPESLRVALLIITAVGFWAALHFHLATRTLRADLAKAGAEA